MDIRELTAADRDNATGLWEEAGLTRPWNEPASDFDGRSAAQPRRCSVLSTPVSWLRR
jgi:hypothetical protein